jgi:hypothetical protein
VTQEEGHAETVATLVQEKEMQDRQVQLLETELQQAHHKASEHAVALQSREAQWQVEYEEKQRVHQEHIAEVHSKTEEGHLQLQAELALKVKENESLQSEAFLQQQQLSQHQEELAAAAGKLNESAAAETALTKQRTGFEGEIESLTNLLQEKDDELERATSTRAHVGQAQVTAMIEAKNRHYEAAIKLVLESKKKQQRAAISAVIEAKDMEKMAAIATVSDAKAKEQNEAILYVLSLRDEAKLQHESELQRTISGLSFQVEEATQAVSTAKDREIDELTQRLSSSESSALPYEGHQAALEQQAADHAVKFESVAQVKDAERTAEIEALCLEHAQEMESLVKQHTLQNREGKLKIFAGHREEIDRLAAEKGQALEELSVIFEAKEQEFEQHKQTVVDAAQQKDADHQEAADNLRKEHREAVEAHEAQAAKLEAQVLQLQELKRSEDDGLESEATKDSMHREAELESKLAALSEAFQEAEGTHAAAVEQHKQTVVDAAQQKDADHQEAADNLRKEHREAVEAHEAQAAKLEAQVLQLQELKRSEDDGLESEATKDSENSDATAATNEEAALILRGERSV